MPKPVLQALLLADHVYRDGQTGKFIIAGTFNSMLTADPSTAAESTPLDPVSEKLVSQGSFKYHQAGSPWVYACLVDVKGTIELILRYVSLKDERIHFQAKISITSEDPIQACEFKTHMPPLPRQFGVYALEVLCDEELLGSLRVYVKAVNAHGNS
jgi:hypothetical protein